MRALGGVQFGPDLGVHVLDFGCAGLDFPQSSAGLFTLGAVGAAHVLPRAGATPGSTRTGSAIGTARTTGATGATGATRTCTAVRTGSSLAAAATGTIRSAGSAGSAANAGLITQAAKFVGVLAHVLLTPGAEILSDRHHALHLLGRGPNTGREVLVAERLQRVHEHARRDAVASAHTPLGLAPGDEPFAGAGGAVIAHGRAAKVGALSGRWGRGRTVAAALLRLSAGARGQDQGRGEG